MRILRYLCYFCIARLLAGAARRAFGGKPAPAKPCDRHGTGIVLGLLLGAALVPFIGAVGLIILGFATGGK